MAPTRLLPLAADHRIERFLQLGPKRSETDGRTTTPPRNVITVKVIYTYPNSLTFPERAEYSREVERTTKHPKKPMTNN